MTFIYAPTFGRNRRRSAQLERDLIALAKRSSACTVLLSIPGIGLLTTTTMVATTSGNVEHFQDARHFASWFGLTPKEYSSGNSRYFGRISKRGDRYLLMLLTHGARSVLRDATIAQVASKKIERTSMSSRTNSESTSDAGHTTAVLSTMSCLSISFLHFGESLYTNG